MRISYIHSIILVAAVYCCMLCGCAHEPDIVLKTRTCASLPAGGRASACVCALDGKAYVFSGRDANGKYKRDLWQYDPATDTWTQLSSCPGKARVKAVMVAHDGALYAGLGFSGEQVYVDSCYLRDLWRYTPSNNQWTKLSDCPYANTVSGVPYVKNNRLYVLYCGGWSHSNDIIYYDFEADKWDCIPDSGKRIEACFAPTGAECDGRFFFGTGVAWKSQRIWYEVDVDADTWTRRASIPCRGRELCASCATDNYVYLFGGRTFAGDLTGGEVFAEYMRYNVAIDKWEYCGNMPCGKCENMIAFTINNTAYFGLGEDEKGITLNNLYCIEK